MGPPEDTGSAPGGPRGFAASLALGACLVVAASSCTGSSGSGSAPGAADARDVLLAARLDDSDSIAAVDEMRFTDAGTRAAAQVLEEGVSGDPLWAATWVYASDPSDPEVLRPLLGNSDAGIRLMAAAALVSIGDPSGFDPLVSALTDEGVLAGSEPPKAAWQFALPTLRRYTGLDLAPVPDDTRPEELGKVLAETHDTWSRWLEANRRSFAFDSATGTWRTV